jgi:hypothetical protein
MTNHGNIISGFKDEAKELIECGNSIEKSYGRGMLEVLKKYELLFAETKKMYSEDEVKRILDMTLIEYSDCVLADNPKWFKQFKK